MHPDDCIDISTQMSSARRGAQVDSRVHAIKRNHKVPVFFVHSRSFGWIPPAKEFRQRLFFNWVDFVLVVVCLKPCGARWNIDVLIGWDEWSHGCRVVLLLFFFLGFSFLFCDFCVHFHFLLGFLNQCFSCFDICWLSVYRGLLLLHAREIHLGVDKCFYKVIVNIYLLLGCLGLSFGLDLSMPP